MVVILGKSIHMHNALLLDIVKTADILMCFMWTCNMALRRLDPETWKSRAHEAVWCVLQRGSGSFPWFWVPTRHDRTVDLSFGIARAVVLCLTMCVVICSARVCCTTGIILTLQVTTIFFRFCNTVVKSNEFGVSAVTMVYTSMCERKPFQVGNSTWISA